MKIDTPEFKRDMADLKNMIKEMNLADLHLANSPRRSTATRWRRCRRIWGKFRPATGQIQPQIGHAAGGLRRAPRFGEQQGALGEQQGKIGEQQSQLADQRRKIVEEATRQLKPIIEQAIREGKGTPLAN